MSYRSGSVSPRETYSPRDGSQRSTPRMVSSIRVNSLSPVGSRKASLRPRYQKSTKTSRVRYKDDDVTPGVGSYSVSRPSVISEIRGFDNRGLQRTSFGNSQRYFEYQSHQGSDSPGVGKYNNNKDIVYKAKNHRHGGPQPMGYQKDKPQGTDPCIYKGTLVFQRPSNSGTAGPGTYETYRSDFDLIGGNKRTHNVKYIKQVTEGQRAGRSGLNRPQDHNMPNRQFHFSVASAPKAMRNESSGVRRSISAPAPVRMSSPTPLPPATIMELPIPGMKKEKPKVAAVSLSKVNRNGNRHAINSSRLGSTSSKTKKRATPNPYHRKPPGLSLGTINQGCVSFNSGSNGTNTNASSPTVGTGTPILPRSGSIQLGASVNTTKPITPKDPAEIENRLSIAAQEVADFLNELNLSAYSESLVDEGYDDIRSLRTLTESDLVELGFRKGHRARLIQAVKEMTMTTPRDTSITPQEQSMCEQSHTPEDQPYTPRNPSESVHSAATL